MRETEILRGLSKAREGYYAAGAVPDKRPSIMSRMVGKMTGGVLGTPSPTPTPTPMQQPSQPVATQAVMQNSGMLGSAARSLSSRKKQLDEAMAYKNGMSPMGYMNGSAPYMDEAGVIHGEGTPTSDNINVRVSPEEAILPAKTVEAIGADNLAALIENTNGVAPSRGLRPAQKFARGAIPKAQAAQAEALGRANALGDQARARTAQAQSFANANATTAAPAAPTPTAQQGGSFNERFKANIPGRGVPGALGNATAAVARGGLGVARRAFVPFAVGAEINDVGGTLLDSEKSTGEKVQSAVESGIKLAGGAIGVGLGGAVGSFAGPVGTAVGGVAGGTAGYNLAEKGVTGLRNVLGLKDPNAGSRSILELTQNAPAGSGGGAATTTAAPAAGAPVPQTGTIGAAPITQQNLAPASPARIPTQSYTTDEQAIQLQNAARNGDASIIPERGTGFIVSNNNTSDTTDPETGEIISAPGTGRPTAINIDTRQTGLRTAQQQAQPAGPYDEVRSLISRAAVADARGTAKGAREGSKLRRQANLLAGIVGDEQEQITRRSGQRTNQALTDQLRLSANSRAERTADIQAADALAKRLNDRFPDTVDEDGNKIDNSAKRAEVKRLLDATVAGFSEADKQKFFNDATGAQRGAEGLDPENLERLLFNLDVRDRVNEAGSGILNSFAGNQAGELSDNLLDYDLDNSAVTGNIREFRNKARVNESDLRYAEGPANPLLPAFLDGTPTNRFTSRLRQGQGGR